jgi:hypothetical protein
LWLIYILIGTIWLALVNSYFRANPFEQSFSMQLLTMAIPTILGVQWGFGQGFIKAPSFMTAWFVGSAFSALAGLFAGWFIFDEGFTSMKWIAVILILAGAWMLK